MAKRKAAEATIIELEEAIGPVKWLRVTSTRDASNKRQNFTINLYSGSRDDSPITPAHISDRNQLNLAIKDSQFSESKLDAREFAKQCLIARVKEAGMFFFFYDFRVNTTSLNIPI